ncbi:MAG: heme-binding protein [Pseudomonadota bacterium]|nr:heme-binding protein [Pseudomonadota bacterium]
MRAARRLALIAVPVLLGLSIAAATGAERLLVTTSSLTTEAALRAARAALENCRDKGFTVAVSVVDRAGSPLVVLRDSLAGAHTPATAAGKASTAVSFRIDTRELAASTGPASAMSAIRQLPNVVAVGGGVVIRAGGALVGGIGVSGAPGGDADDACARAGVMEINDAIELE